MAGIPLLHGYDEYFDKDFPEKKGLVLLYNFSDFLDGVPSITTQLHINLMVAARRVLVDDPKGLTCHEFVATFLGLPDSDELLHILNSRKKTPILDEPQAGDVHAIFGDNGAIHTSISLGSIDSTTQFASKRSHYPVIDVLTQKEETSYYESILRGWGSHEKITDEVYRFPIKPL
jgi:hypothetical protein